MKSMDKLLTELKTLFEKLNLRNKRRFFITKL